MKNPIRKAGLILVLAALAAAAGQPAAAEGLAKIADGVYSYVDTKQASPQNGFGANAGIVVGKNGVLVVDTLVSAKMAKQFIKDIRAVTDKPIRYVVNTHAHLDHAFGNSEFRALGALIVGHADCKRDMAAKGEAVLKNIGAYGLTDKDMEGTSIALPELTFTDRMEIDLGDATVELVYPGPSHSPGSIVAYVPAVKVLFAGDVLFTGYHPFMGEGDLKGWLKALDRIDAMDAARIIPGHGPVSGKKDIADMKDYMRAFDTRARELCLKSRDIEYVSSEIMKFLPKRAEAEFLVKSNLEMMYLPKRGE